MKILSKFNFFVSGNNSAGVASLSNIFVLNRDSISRAQRWLSSQAITPNLTLYTDKPRQIVKDTKSLRLRQQANGKPLAVILSWMQARPKHLEKFCSIYTNLGFDVIVLKVKTWQVILPVNGSQVVVGDVCKFLASNEGYERVLLHGFSVGGYIWGECLIHMHMHQNADIYGKIEGRIKSQIWDSVVGVQEWSSGVSKAIFSRNQTLQNWTGKALDYYLKVNYNWATKHYMRSDDEYSTRPIAAPALLFVSKTDTIGSETKSRQIAECFERLNISTTLKVFDRSPHVQHFQKHKDEYLKCLLNHLELCEMIGKSDRTTEE